MQTASEPAGVTAVPTEQKQVPQQAGPAPAIADAGLLFTTRDSGRLQIHRPLEVHRRSLVAVRAVCVDTALKQDSAVG